MTDPVAQTTPTQTNPGYTAAGGHTDGDWAAARAQHKLLNEQRKAARRNAQGSSSPSNWSTGNTGQASPGFNRNASGQCAPLMSSQVNINNLEKNMDQAINGCRVNSVLNGPS